MPQIAVTFTQDEIKDLLAAGTETRAIVDQMNPEQRVKYNASPLFSAWRKLEKALGASISADLL